MKDVIKKTLERKILLNPGPATTSVHVKAALLVEDVCPREKEFGELVTSIRQKALEVVNASGNYETVLLGCSGTGAIESCLSSSTNSEDRILIVENGAYGKRMKQICDSLGIQSECLKFDWGSEINWEQVDEFILKSQLAFKVIALVHHETTTGILNSLECLNEISRKHNLVTMVDAMSSYAGIEIDLENLDLDYLISSSNKCIQGMAGVGIVIVKTQELERIKSFTKRNFYFDLYANYYSQKEKKQFLFTPPVQTLYALNAALNEFLEAGGVVVRSSRYAKLYDLMFKGLCELGFKPLLEEKNNSKILTTFLEPKCPNYSFDSMHDYLFDRGITIYPGKVDHKDTFRISNIGDLKIEDIDFFIKILGEYLTYKEIKLK